MFGILIVFVAFTGSIVFSGWFENTLYSQLAQVASTTYSELETIINLQGATSYQCTGLLQTFTVTTQGIIQMNSFLSYKNAIAYSGGLPSKNIVYFSGSNMFVVSPYAIYPGTYTDSEKTMLPVKATNTINIPNITVSSILFKGNKPYQF